MSGKTLTMPQVRSEGILALLERLGPADTIRFLQQFYSGQGDYTSERHGWLDQVTLEEIVRSIEQRRQAG